MYLLMGKCGKVVSFRVLLNIDVLYIIDSIVFKNINFIQWLIRHLNYSLESNYRVLIFTKLEIFTSSFYSNSVKNNVMLKIPMLLEQTGYVSP